MERPDEEREIPDDRRHERDRHRNELTMETLMTAAWNETEKEHRSYVAERIKRRNKKLDEAYGNNGKYLHLWIRQDYQVPIATMKNADGDITINFQEIRQTLSEAWRLILARWSEEADPQYTKFKERFGPIHPKAADGRQDAHRSGAAQHGSAVVEQRRSSWKRGE